MHNVEVICDEWTDTLIFKVKLNGFLFDLQASYFMMYVKDELTGLIVKKYVSFTRTKEAFIQECERVSKMLLEG